MGNKEKGKEKKIEVGDLGWAMIFFLFLFFLTDKSRVAPVTARRLGSY